MQATVSTGVSGRPLVKRPPGAKYRTVLSIDGGGVRGIIPVMVLKKLEGTIKQHIYDNRETLIPAESSSLVGSVEDFDVDLTDYFSVVAGTSAGSWLAGYIAARGRGAEALVTNQDLQNRYGTQRLGAMEPVRIVIRELARRVFPRRNFFTRLTRLTRPAYPSDGLTSLLKDVFGDTTMNDLETGCLITSYDIGRNAACSFIRGPGPDGRTYLVRTAAREHPRTSASDGVGQPQEDGRIRLGEGDEWEPDLDVFADKNFRLRDIAHASSAAPTYFNPAEISSVNEDDNERLILVDGGVVAINPAVQVMTYAPNTLEIRDIRSVALFSVGCGTTDPSGNRDETPGIAWWLGSGYLIDILMNGTSEYIQSMLDFWIYRNLNLPYGQYVRVQTTGAPGTERGRVLSALDAVDNLQALEDIGRELADANEKAIQNFVKSFMFAT